MVVIVPVVVMMPATPMLVPPLLALSPAAFPDFVQFTTPVVCLPAEVSVVLNGFVESVLRALGPPLTKIVSHGSRRQEQ
jgi:hypothetical protein